MVKILVVSSPPWSSYHPGALAEARDQDSCVVSSQRLCFREISFHVKTGIPLGTLRDLELFLTQSFYLGVLVSLIHKIHGKSVVACGVLPNVGVCSLATNLCGTKRNVQDFPGSIWGAIRQEV